MFQFPGEIKMRLCLHDTKHPVNSIKNNSQFGGRWVGGQLVRLLVCHYRSEQNRLVNHIFHFHAYHLSQLYL